MTDGTAGRRGRKAVQDIDRQVGARIRERRIALGLTLRQLAERIGTSEQQARKYEKGQHCVTARRLYLIAQALDVEPGRFFEGLGTERPTGPGRPMPLELARHFVDLPSRRHQEVFAELARALTERRGPAVGRRPHSSIPRRSLRHAPARPATFAVLAVLAVLSPAGAGAAPLLILEQDCCGTAARPWTMASHLAYIDTLPFDGISLNIPFTWAGLNAGTTYGYAAIMSQLAPVAGKLTKVNKNFVKVTVRRCADVFDDWAAPLCLQHWKDLADAARDSGMAGIMFDNEEYDAGSQVWNYPADVRYGATRTLTQYREQTRSRGEQVMRVLQAEWPAVRVLHFHGPYTSDARVPGAPCANDGRDTSDLRGYFFAGMLAAAGPDARVVDGGECYNLRSANDFQQSWNWRKNTFPTLANNPIVPSSLSAAWPTKIGVNFGAFDQPWAGFAMDQATLQRTLTNALLRADPDGVVWLYTESHDYLSPTNPVPTWLAAVANARKAAGARGRG